MKEVLFIRNNNLREEVIDVSELVVDHESEQTHLGGTSLVKLKGTLGHLGLSVKGVPAKVEGVIAEVTNEFSSGDVLHDGKLKGANEGNNLRNSGTRDGVEGGETVGDIGEGKSGVVNVSRKVDSGLVDKVSDTPSIQIRPCLIST